MLGISSRPSSTPQPWTRGSSSWPFLRRRSLALSAAAPDLGRGVTPLGRAQHAGRSRLESWLKCRFLGSAPIYSGLFGWEWAKDLNFKHASQMTLFKVLHGLYLEKHCHQFSHSVMSNSLRPHESQHARPPCPSPTPGVHPNSCPSSQSCHPAISSSVVIPPSLRVFSNETILHMRWPKHWSFSFSISPSKEYPGLISFRMD